jgi:hypothetical protein
MSFDKARKVSVSSRNAGSLAYTIPSLRVRREWSKSGEENFISIDELIELTTIPGGRKLLEEYLLINDDEAIEAVLGHEVQPEYKYTEKEIEFLLYGGTDEQFADCLDYAPAGVLELLKNMAVVKMPNTTFKVTAINDKFKINLSTLNKNYEADEIFEEATSLNGRRTAPVVVTAPPKTESAPKYKITK